MLQINFLGRRRQRGAGRRCTPPRSRSSGRCSDRSSRPFGGKLADRIGGGKITLYTFVAMIFAAGILVLSGVLDDRQPGAPTGGQMIGYVAGFILLFILSGHRQRLDLQDDPVDLRGQGRRAWTSWSRDEKAAWSRRMSGALIGFAGAVGALGGVFINVVLRASYVG